MIVEENTPKKKHGLVGRKRPLEVREKISRSLKGKAKEYPSYLKGLKGSLHPSYKHGLGCKNRDYDPKMQAAWIQGVKRGSSFKCFITGDTSNLECHHLIGWSYEPTRYSIENGVAIAATIHKLFHNEYGRGLNTPEQFEEFCKKHYGITSFPWRQGNHKPSFSLFEENAKIEGFLDKKAKEFAQLVSERNHEIVEGVYFNNSSCLQICCQKHNPEKSIVVKAGLYKKAKFGLPCCAREKQSHSTSAANKQRASLPVHTTTFSKKAQEGSETT